MPPKTPYPNIDTTMPHPPSCLTPLTAGFLVWIGSVITEAAVIEFSRVLGSVLYVGAGAMVSP